MEVAVEASGASQVAGRRAMLLQPRRKREINVKRALGESSPDRGSSSSALVPADYNFNKEGSQASSAAVERFKPKLYVPERLKTHETQQNTNPTNSILDQYASAHQVPSHYSSRVIKGINDKVEQPANSGISTSRGTFQLRARRNIRVKSFDDLDDNKPAESVRRTEERAAPRKEYTPIVRTGLLSEANKDKLARQERQSVSDMLGSGGTTSTYQPMTSAHHEPIHQPMEPMEPHYGDISDGLEPQFVEPYQPELTQYGVPSEGDQFSQNGAMDGYHVTGGYDGESYHNGDQEVFHGHPSGLEAQDSYEDRIAAITSRLHANRTTPAAPTIFASLPTTSSAPEPAPAGEETIDEKKERILRNLMNSKMEAARVASGPSDPNFESLEDKKARIFAQLRQKHSGNNQAQQLLDTTVSTSMTSGFDILGLSRQPRSLSLGASLGSEPRQLVGMEAQPDDMYSQSMLEPQGNSYTDMYHTDNLTEEPGSMYNREPIHTDVYNTQPTHTDMYAREPIHTDIFQREPVDRFQREPVDIFEREPVGTFARDQAQTEVVTDTHTEPVEPLTRRGPILLGRQKSSDRELSNVSEPRKYTDYNNGVSNDRLRASPNEDLCSVDSGFHGGDVNREDSPPTRNIVTRQESPRTERSVRSSSRERTAIQPRTRSLSRDRKKDSARNTPEKKPAEKPKKPPVPIAKAGVVKTSGPVKTSGVVKTPGVVKKDNKKVEQSKPNSIWKEIAKDGEDSSEETLIRPSDVKAARGNMVLKKGAPPTHPKPAAKTTAKPPQTPTKSHQSRIETPVKTTPKTQPPRPKSAPPSKAKSVANLAEVALSSPRMERRASVASSRDDLDAAGTGFTRNSRLRSSTKAWEARQAEKQAEVKGRRVSVSKAPLPRPPGTPTKRPVITGQVSLSPERAAMKEKPQHTPRMSVNYDKPWRTGTSLSRDGSAGSFLIRSAQPDRGTPDRGKKPTSEDSSASSSRAQSPSSRPKNPVKDRGSVVSGFPRSPRSRTQPNSPTRNFEEKPDLSDLRINIKPKPSKKPFYKPKKAPGTPTGPKTTTPKPFRFSYIPRHRRNSQSDTGSEFGSEMGSEIGSEVDRLDDFLRNEEVIADEEKILKQLAEEWKTPEEDESPNRLTVSPDSGMSTGSGRVSPILSKPFSVFNNWIETPAELSVDCDIVDNATDSK